jgi:hypothetical protein
MINRLDGIYGVSFFLLLAGCASATHEVEKGSNFVIPSELALNPDRYDGKMVLVKGWMTSSTENRRIWDSEESRKRGPRSQDCISLLIPYGMETGRFDKKDVEIEAIFVSKLPQDFVNLGGCSFSSSALKLQQGKLPKAVN